MTTPTPTTAPGPVTLADVRAALGNTDPNSTNASVVRKAIGRGSLQTIQRCLAAIRAELVPVPAVSAGSVPAAPADAVSALWAVAWTMAQAQTLSRLDDVTAQRDAAQAALTTAHAEIDMVAGQLDELETGVLAADAQAAASEEAAKAAADALAAAQSGAADAAQVAADELARVTAKLQHAAELATRDAELAAASMQRTIDRLTDQVGELKSLLHSRPSAP
jgi:hypothetical protein